MINVCILHVLYKVRPFQHAKTKEKCPVLLHHMSICDSEGFFFVGEVFPW